jgi:Domain of unknown function (DUF397)
VAALPSRRIAVRDSKDEARGPALVFTPADWRRFVEDVAGRDR